jgi:hypothetical protein
MSWLRYSILLGVSIIFLFSYPAISHSVVIEGILLSQEGPIEDSKVYAYNKFQDVKTGDPLYSSVTGEKKGFYKLELPPGKYYLIAFGKFKGKEYFSFHGANPITVKDSNLWIPFMMLPKTVPDVRDASYTGLRGKITFKGRPVKGAQVSIYPLTESTFRGMGFLTGTTDRNGIFTLRPEPGEYVIIARKRINFRGIRPLKKGDLFCFFSGNPLSIEASKEISVEIPCYPKDDLKAFLDERVYPVFLVKKSDSNSIRFRENKIQKPLNIIKIKGRVTDLNGDPMQSLYVMAYKGRPSQIFQMLYVRTMPDYLVRTDEKGYYTIEASEEGTYYIVARELIGEAPLKGEYYGLYEGNANHSVILRKDPIDGIDIRVSKLMMKQIQNSKFRIQNKIRDYRYSGDTVIRTDTLWEGEVVVEGTVYVARGVTLTINPGTVIKFKKIDLNHDGVGDSKIRVSGRLIARGKPNDMIRFTSAEKNPNKMDWSYLLFFVSSDESTVSYCIFEYAFTGVQVHFSNAVITDSVFFNNQEGIRFGRTELRIEHNDIHNNIYGIRHTRLEGSVRIAYNNIKNNRIGIFLVPSNQNIVNFTDTFYKKDSFPEFQPIVSYNNISYNDEYNYRLGERQGYNILLKDNWWGSKKDKDISDTIYDEKMDKTLGKVVYKPYLMAPVKDAGVRRGG